jgi:hypothetical protein|tara:strand:+ start:518 stop:718 length:201 start_codon:yes stop_codon:yes gene_type:complete
LKEFEKREISCNSGVWDMYEKKKCKVKKNIYFIWHLWKCLWEKSKGVKMRMYDKHNAESGSAREDV